MQVFTQLFFENLLHVPVRIFIFLLIFMDIPVMAFSIDVGGVPMEVYLKNTIIYSGLDWMGRNNVPRIFNTIDKTLPDGVYTAQFVIDSVSPLYFVFN